MKDQKPTCNAVINFYCQLCGIFHLEWDLAEGGKERADEVPDPFLCPVLVPPYRSISHFSEEISLLFLNPIFPKLPASAAAAAPASAQSKAQCPIKPSYPYRKESFISLSLPHYFTHSIHHQQYFPPFSITFLFSITLPC